MSTAQEPAPLTAVALSCSLNPSPTESSSELMACQLLDTLSDNHQVAGAHFRVADYHITPGVLTDMGGNDQWPALRQQILDAHLLVLSTPTWLGHASSMAQRALERLDAELSETDSSGRKLISGKLALIAVVGNEDGAHKIIADCGQALNDIGFTLPANGSVYWNANIEQPSDYKDLPGIPDPVRSMMTTAAANAVHLARHLTDHPYPPAT